MNIILQNQKKISGYKKKFGIQLIVENLQVISMIILGKFLFA